ncbi:MAG: phosphoribosylformylglycinamidine synthase, partial [Christensenellales bacterium]
MVKRIYIEKKPGFANEAAEMLRDLREFLGIDALRELRLFNRYDVEGISDALFARAVATVFSEPQLDIAFADFPAGDAAHVFAAEFLPGQYDQRADSAAQCIQIISQGERPIVRAAKVYALYGDISGADIARIKAYIINPVESREASLAMPETLQMKIDAPEDVEVLTGFIGSSDEELADMIDQLSLAMDFDDLALCRAYFSAEGRDPTITEIRMLDTYWSDHCRHTTFLTAIGDVQIHDPVIQAAYADYLATREALGRADTPVNLMDIATIAARALRSEGRLEKLDASDEVNACTVRIDVDVDGEMQEWLLLFKNETHNHPTEIEPFGGAATCIGGAIRDPLSGRAYVYGAMRVTGAANPLAPVSETMPGKLPQRKLTATAAAGYASYGNQIGVATGQVDEIYHEGYKAKRMEIGAVIGAVPAANVRRETPAPGDVVILIGGRTGRDGCGGATGSSKSHTRASLDECGAQVQKGNAPEERKLQRLFRNPAAARMIKRCNDFGAGGVSVAIGELADGLEIDLDCVPRKYEGLDGTEVAISESQERMAVVVAPEDAARFLALAQEENLEATEVARVTGDDRLVMRFGGQTIVDVSRAFLSSNGAQKRIDIVIDAPEGFDKPVPTDFIVGMEALVGDLNVCSKRGLSERFDSTVGAGTVLMPFGGKYQLTPSQVMAQKVSVETGDTRTCSLMAWGYNPFIAEKSPFHGAYLAVVESVSKLIAAGAQFEDVYLTLQEYFAKPGRDARRWGQPLSALLGALRAQRE